MMRPKAFYVPPDRGHPDMVSLEEERAQALADKTGRQVVPLVPADRLERAERLLTLMRTVLEFYGDKNTYRRHTAREQRRRRGVEAVISPEGEVLTDIELDKHGSLARAALQREELEDETQ